MKIQFESFPLARRYSDTVKIIAEGDYQSIIDAGCGDGNLLYLLKHNYKSRNRTPDLMGVDVADEKLKRARDRAGARVIKADIADLPFEPGRFSLVICNEVIEHIPNPTKAISELVRIAKDDGTVVVSIPVVSWFRYIGVTLGGKLKFLDEQEHLREYSLTRLQRCETVGAFFKSLKAAGLQVRKVRGAYFWPDKGQRIIDWVYFKLPWVSAVIAWLDGVLGRIPIVKFLGRWVIVECRK